MSRLIQLLFALVLIGITLPVAAQHYYDPDSPGHGLTVQSVGDGYAAQWYANTADGQLWLASDVCGYGETCPVYVTDARGFPAAGAGLIDAGEIVLDPTDDGVLLTYELQISEITCADLPGPHPPECRDENGDRLSDVVVQPGLDESGAVELELLVD